jgi:homoserine dehydrogenase
MALFFCAAIRRGGGVRFAILGFGTVGQAVARLVLARHAGALQLTHICNRDVQRKRVAWVPDDVVWTDDVERVLGDGPQLVVELVGGLTPAHGWVRRALESGASVVTANKQLIAHHGAELMELARRRGVALRFEGSVAGGVPVLRAIEDGLAADRLVRVAGVLNGTSTHILSRMEDNQSFASALAEARTLGYAEADPSDDLTGRDAAAKLAILSATALGQPICCTDISSRSIDAIEPIDLRYAAELGCTIRQVAWAEHAERSANASTEQDTDDCIIAVVRPALVPRESPLARVVGNQNVVTVEGERGGQTAFFGRGAGGDPTAVAVVSDMLAIAQDRRGARAAAASAPGRVSADYTAPHYVRFTVADRPGILAAVAEAFASQEISINAVLQHPGWPQTKLPFVMTLEPCPEARLDAAMAEIARMDFHVQPPVVLPIVDAGRVSA